MSKKQKIIFFSFVFILSLAFLLLTIFLVPNTIPLLFDISEKIVITGSKYFLLIIIILLMTFAILCITLKNDSAIFIVKLLYLVSNYELMIIFIYLLTGTNFEVGQTPDISLTFFTFLPLSIIIMAFGAKLKTAPYNSKLGIQFKCTKETEFIWKQTHFFASRVYLVLGLILLIISAIFAFFNLSIIVFAIFAVALLICNIIIYNYSHSIYKKYASMKEKHDKITNKENNDTNVNKV